MAYLDDAAFVLNIQPIGLPTIVRLSQNENGRRLYFTIIGNETAIPSGVTVTLSGTKPDGVVYSKVGSISNGVVLINEDTQLTAAAGNWDAKIKIVSGGQTVATGRVRFIIDADPVASGSVPSDSQLEGLVAEAEWYAENARSAAYGSPLVASTVAGMTDHTRVYVYTGSESGYTSGHWYYWSGSAWTDGGVYNSAAVQTDTTLALPGMAADAKATGDAVRGLGTRMDTAEDDITDLKSDLNNMQEEIDDFEGISDDVKVALLACFRHIAFLDEDEDYYTALRDALYASDTVISISAVFNQGSTVIYPDESLDNLRTMLVVTGLFEDGTSRVISGYALSGTLIGDTLSTITVTYRDKATTFTVSVTDYEWGSDYTWLYRPDIDGLLSNNENISEVKAIGGSVYATEQIINGKLNIHTEDNGADHGSIFEIIPSITTNATLKMKVKFNELPIGSPGAGLRAQISNGTSGAQFYVTNVTTQPTSPRLWSFNGPDTVALAQIELNRWYILSCELANGNQKVKMDANTYNMQSLSTYANTKTRIIALQPTGNNTGNLDFDVAWIAFKNNSNS